MEKGTELAYKQTKMESNLKWLFKKVFELKTFYEFYLLWLL